MQAPRASVKKPETNCDTRPRSVNSAAAASAAIKMSTIEACRNQEAPFNSSKITVNSKRRNTQETILVRSNIPRAVVVVAALLAFATFGGVVKAKEDKNAADIVKQKLPDLASGTSDEPIEALAGQDAFVSCVAKDLSNYTIIWKFSAEADAAAASRPNAELVNKDAVVVVSTTTEPTAESDESGTSPSSMMDDFESVAPTGEFATVILTAGQQRVISDDRFSVIRSHDTWLLKIRDAKPADTGTYICETNSAPPVRAIRVLSVVVDPTEVLSNRPENIEDVEHNFVDCCQSEFVIARCQRLCNFQTLASQYQSINIVHECFSALPSITRCMVGGRNVSECCLRRHVPHQCQPICGKAGDTSSMSVQDHYLCADYSAPVMSCVAEGVRKLPKQPELVIVEAVSPTSLKVSWQRVADDAELAKLDGFIIQLVKLSSFGDSVSSSTSSSLSNTSMSFSSSSTLSASSPLANLTIVDVINNASLASMNKLLAAASGTISLKLDKRQSEFSIDNLRPHTVYQIQMFAYNSHGRSQLTEPIRALTLAPDSFGTNDDDSDQTPPPELPDTRKCCAEAGVTQRRCLDTLCDPVEADKASVADLMICAPWTNVTFGCLSSRTNHSDCCQARGVSPFCLSICAGDVKRVDYRHFRCLTHMSAYTNCILDSHGVLPSRPRNFTVGPITSSWAVLNWKPPKRLARTLQGYRIFWRKVDSPLPAQATSRQLITNNNKPPTTTTTLNRNGSPPPIMSGTAPATAVEAATQSSTANPLDEYYFMSSEAATNPYLLDALTPETIYETFVVAVNKFGESESSTRFIFETLKELSDSSSSFATSGAIEARLPLHPNGGPNQPRVFYNETACCVNGGVSRNCQQLCDYDMKVADVGALITKCQTQMPTVLRCMAGARNSVPCCRTRGVSDSCLNVCAGLSEYSPLVIAMKCASDFGKIIRCMDEGSKQIPSAPVELHTTEVTPTSVSITWKPAAEDALRADVDYQVRYQQLVVGPSSSSNSDSNQKGNFVPLHPLEHNLIMTTNSTSATIDKLKPNSHYSVYVMAQNSYGISLPSLVLVLTTTTNDEKQAEQQHATLGAPHSLEVLHQDTESIVLKWIAPLFMASDADVKYRVFYKLISGVDQSSSSSSTQTATVPPSSQDSSSSSSPPGATQQLSTSIWTKVETSDSTIQLRNLRYSSQYAIAVQAVSKTHTGHWSEIILTSTSRPIPPTINEPMIIGQPVEGNNITIMCVALGQPIPQLSMFINGLLVQKRVQPYVIYHLVNLVRSQLTITCFASNGHGKHYASVQSRLELSVKFGAKAKARAKSVRANQQSAARLTCEVTGNPKPTVIWTFSSALSKNTNPASNSTILRPSSELVVTPSDRIGTLLVAQFDQLYTWTYTLTVRNVSQADAGQYRCKSRNMLGVESSDAIELQVIDPLSSGPLDNISASSLEQNTDLVECCKSQNVSSKCLPVCNGADGLDVETAFKTDDCQSDLDKVMFCAANGSDHRNCCRMRQVPPSCLRWCSGAKFNIPAFCLLSAAVDINQCFMEGRSSLPGPPRNLRMSVADSSRLSGAIPAHQAQSSTTSWTSFMADRLTAAQSAGSDANQDSTTTPISSMLMMMGEHSASSGSIGASSKLQAPANQLAPDLSSESSTTEQPLLFEWDPPTKNPQLVQYYRVFWRPFGSRQLSRTLTNLTYIVLGDLSANKMYEFVVKAANVHGSSIYSEPFTVKPEDVIAEAGKAYMWFIPATGSQSLPARVGFAVAFATFFMFTTLAIVLLLERRGYLRSFASSKSNSSRVSFANPAYTKDSDPSSDIDAVNWDSQLAGGHSLDVLGPVYETSNDRDATNGESQLNLVK